MPTTGPAGPFRVSGFCGRWFRLIPGTPSGLRPRCATSPLPWPREGVAADERQRALEPILTSLREMQRTNRYWLERVLTGSARYPQQLDWSRSLNRDYASISEAELSGLAGALSGQPALRRDHHQAGGGGGRQSGGCCRRWQRRRPQEIEPCRRRFWRMPSAAGPRGPRLLHVLRDPSAVGCVSGG